MSRNKTYTKLLAIRVEEELLLVFQMKCEQEGKTVSEAIREFMKNSIEFDTTRD
jgi:antitoxin component of RelBE/YafQ-DinJ toxin-antitoxin module